MSNVTRDQIESASTKGLQNLYLQMTGTMGKIDPNGNNKAENMIALASYHARHTTEWNSKAEGYISDVESLLADCKYDAARAAALRSLEYSIGILLALDELMAKLHDG